MTRFEDRRIEPRAAAAYTISFESYRNGIKIGEGQASTVDVSEHGALVEMPYSPSLDASLILSINAPFYTLVLRGDVIHARPAPDGLFRVGLKLTEAIEGNWEHLKLDIRSRIKHKLENEE